MIALTAAPNPAPAKNTARIKPPAAIFHLTHADMASAIKDSSTHHNSMPMKIDPAIHRLSRVHSQPAKLALMANSSSPGIQVIDDSRTTSTVILPTLTAQYARNEVGPMRSTLWAGVRVLVFISAACAGGLLALRYQIIALLYQHGDRFTAASTELVAEPLFWFSLGLVSYAVVEVLTRTFYAMQDTRTPVKIAVITVLLNALFAWSLVGTMGQGGLALSLAASSFDWSPWRSCRPKPSASPPR